LWTGKKPPRQPTAEEVGSAQALREQEALVAAEYFDASEHKSLVRMVERRLWHEFPISSRDYSCGTLKTSGQFDVVLFHPKTRRALICDGKSGWLAIRPNPTNLQLRRLAALLWLELSPAEIGVCILRPFENSDPVCRYTHGDLKRSVQELEEDVRQSHEPNAARTAGEEQCCYCRARDLCPTRLAWISEALPQRMLPLPMISARQWTPAQRAFFLDREKDAREWLEARKHEIKQLLSEAADAVPGYRLRPGRAIEAIVDAHQVMKRFCGDLGGTMEAFLKCVKLGKTALREQLRVLSGHRGEMLEADLDALLRGSVECKGSAPNIERLTGPTLNRVSVSARQRKRRGLCQPCRNGARQEAHSGSCSAKEWLKRFVQSNGNKGRR
jgi:hypothetical protein